MRVIRLALLTSFLPVPHLAAQTADTVRFTPTVGYPTFAVRDPVLRIQPGTVLISNTNFGEYYTEAVKTGLEYLRDRYRQPERLQWTFYSNYYAAQAFYRAGGDDWNLWLRKGIPYVLSLQVKRSDATGAWNDHELATSPKAHGRAYATAMSCLALSVQDGYLPLFQR